MAKRIKTLKRDPYWTADIAGYRMQASADMIKRVISAPVNRYDGRSCWYWIRMIDGSLMLATYPRGDLYFETELDHLHL